MKGVVFEKQGDEPKVVDTLEKPAPGPDQLLVKSLWIAINPVDSYMASWGILVCEWPLVLGVDAAGVIVDVGEVAQEKYSFKPGDYVCGCTRLGFPAYSAGQEYFLMDAQVTFPKPENVDLRQAVTLGAGGLTACLALFEGLNIDLLDPGHLPSEKDGWVVVLGGASSVGKFAVQLARLAGYKVLASCSARSEDVVKSYDAAIFHYSLPLEQQLKQVREATKGDVARIFDATASDDPALAKELFKGSDAESKYFATTNDWTRIGDFAGGKTYECKLGGIGRPEETTLNTNLEKYIGIIGKLVTDGKLKPSDYEVVGAGGLEDAIQAYKYQLTGKAGSRKVIVKIQDE